MSVHVIDKGWKQIQKELKLIQGAYVKVGFPSEKSKKHQGQSGVDVAAVAAFQEYGTEHIPARPFMVQTFEKNRQEVKEFVEKEQAKIYDGKQTTEQSLNRLGNFYKGKIQKTIRNGEFAPNASGTIKQKGSSKPLIDTGQMRQSVDYEVKIK